MIMEIYCIVCSRKKIETLRPVDSINLYLSPNIRNVYEMSKHDGVEFRILSGKFGLLAPHDKVERYDYLLKDDAVEGLVEKLKDQIRSQGIDMITFFAENRQEHPNWGPYYDAIIGACEDLGIRLERIEID